MSRSSFVSRNEASWSGSGSSSSLASHNISGVPNCKCDSKAVVYISKTEKNPCRTFYGCRYYKDRSGCNFFLWVDDYIGKRLTMLEEGRNQMEIEMKDMEVKMKELQVNMKGVIQLKKSIIIVVFMVVVAMYIFKRDLHHQLERDLNQPQHLQSCSF